MPLLYRYRYGLAIIFRYRNPQSDKNVFLPIAYRIRYYELIETQQTRENEMQVISQETQSDGSAWTAVVVVAGVMFRAAYVANSVRCSLGPYKHAPRRPRWCEKAVREWAKKQVADLPAEWHQKHREMYA